MEKYGIDNVRGGSETNAIEEYFSQLKHYIKGKPKYI
jgi:hypothetical protein